MQGCNTDSKVHGANMGPIWGRQDPGGPPAGPINFAIWEGIHNIDIVLPVNKNDTIILQNALSRCLLHIL